MLIEDFIKLEIKKPFIWGETDCCSTTDRWVKNLIGFSHLEKLNRKSSIEWLNEKGMIKPALKAINKFKKLKITEKPEKGDVALLILGNFCAFSIKTENFWFTRNESGIIGAPLNSPILRSWTCQKQFY